VKSPVAGRIAVIALLLAIWEIAARVWGDPLFVCPPSAVIGGIGTITHNGRIDSALLTAFLELLTAFAFAVVLGVPLGVLLGRNRISRLAVLPVVLLLYVLPQATLLPLFVLLFGVGAKAKIVFGFTHGIFPMVLTVAAATRSIDPTLVRAARSLGATRRQIVTHIVLPSAVPGVFTGMRLAMAATLLGVLLAELYVSSAGVGAFTSQFTNAFQPPKLFALIVLLAFMAVVLNELCRLAEARFSRWKA
jgi:ABC-type nitrate/sulfonate/bicarbonate transport system permease component